MEKDRKGGVVLFLFLPIDTRLGEIALVWCPGGPRPIVHRVFLPGERLAERVRAAFPGAREAADAAMQELAESMAGFMDGEDRAFPLGGVAMDACGTFQRSVLIAEHRVPRGSVTTYGRIAVRLGRSGAARAVGRALATNPFPIIVPCHRAVRSDGALGGYQGGERMKRALLELEGAEFTSSGRLKAPRFFY